MSNYNNTDDGDFSGMNSQILDEVSQHDVPENAEIVFENHSQDSVSPKEKKKKRFILMLAVMTVVLGAGYVINQKKHTNESANQGDAIDAAIASATNATAEGNIAIAIGSAPPSSGDAIQGPSVAVEAPSITPELSITPPTITSQDSKQPEKAIPEPQIKAKPVDLVQPTPTVAVRHVARNERKTSVTEPLLVIRNKLVEAVLMRNMGVVGVIQKTNPRERTVETDERIYKFN